MNTRCLLVAWGACVLAIAGCATVDDGTARTIERVNTPPFVIHLERPSASDQAVVLSPVSLDRTTVSEILLPSQAEVFAELATAMDARLAAMPCCNMTDQPLSDNGAPLVYVGSALGATAPRAAARFVESWDVFTPMVVSVEPPSDDWQARVATQPPAPAYLWIRLSLAEYSVRSTGLFNRTVLLGEQHEAPQPFLRSEMTPVQVLQVTGVLVASDGRVLAAGGEGIRTIEAPLTTQLLAAQREIDPQVLRELMTELRREDLPGKPLNWEAALDNLVRRLLEPR